MIACEEGPLACSRAASAWPGHDSVKMACSPFRDRGSRPPDHPTSRSGAPVQGAGATLGWSGDSFRLSPAPSVMRKGQKPSPGASHPGFQILAGAGEAFSVSSVRLSDLHHGREPATFHHEGTTVATSTRWPQPREQGPVSVSDRSPIRDRSPGNVLVGFRRLLSVLSLDLLMHVPGL